MIFIKLIFLSLIVSNCSHSYSQEVIFVPQNGDFEEETEIYVTLQFDRKPAIELIIKNAKINIAFILPV